MSTVKASWSQLPAQGEVIEVCQNLPGDRLASSSVDDGVAYIQIWERDCSSGDWDLVSQVVAPDQVTHLVWSHPEFGHLLAGGTSTGSVLILEAPRPSCVTESSAGSDENETMQDMKDWSISGVVQCSKYPIKHLSFGPRQLGLTLAVASHDGDVCILEADRLLAPNSWTIQSRFHAGSKDPKNCECIGLSWRSFSPGTAPLVAVALKDTVEVWQYVRTIMSWQQVATLPLSQSGDVSGVHWAATLGRPCDLIAVAQGSSVDVISLTGDTLAMKMELLATLKHSAPVWKVEYNMFGTCLAAATEDNLVHLWKPDFAGKWLLVSIISGNENVDEAK